MVYEYDIFISYRRLGETRTWIESFLVPLIVHHLSVDLGRTPKIFVDSQIEVGDSWPIVLGNAISSSKVIIPLWTRKYLQSLWCSCEIGHMLERERKLGYRCSNNPGGLIFPVIINDGDTMPVQISTIQKLEMQEFFKLTLNKDGTKYTEFEDKVKLLADKIGIALVNAPGWQEDWQIETVNNFVSQLYVKEESLQSQPPQFLAHG